MIGKVCRRITLVCLLPIVYVASYAPATKTVLGIVRLCGTHITDQRELMACLWAAWLEDWRR